MKNKSIVNITRYFMIITGLWKLPLTQNVFKQKCYNLYSLIVLSTLNVFTISVIVKLILLIVEGAAPAKIFSSLTIAIVICMMSYNVLIYLKNGIPYLFSQIIQQEIEALLHSKQDPEIKRCYLRQTEYYKFTTACQVTSTGLSAIMFVASNLYRKLAQGLSEHDVFMYEMWFPFDKAEHDSLVVLINMVMVTLGFSVNVVSRITPQTLIIFVNAQLRIFQIRLRKVFSSDDDERLLEYKLKEMVKQHQILMRYVTSLNNSIKSIIFMEYVLNSLNVAAALLQVITVKTLVEMAYSMFHLTLTVVQIFVFAWSANEVNIQSANIANAVYDSNWLGQSEEIKKIVYIMLMRAQKPLALTIGPFRPINLQSALITMKGAYSFASVMIQKYT